MGTLPNMKICFVLRRNIRKLIHVESLINLNNRSMMEKKKITLDEKFWIVVNNTHEALVDKDTFEYVNSLRSRYTRNYDVKTGREKRLLRGTWR